VKLSELPNPNATEQTLGIATRPNCTLAKFKQFPLEQVSALSKHLILD